MRDIPDDSTAAVTAANLLGSKFIDITKGQSATPVKPGGELRSLDASLWLGTQNGIARYTATEVGWGEFKPRLEAFPDLGTGLVLDLREDARGLVWFATDRGLFRHDGRGMWEFRALPLGAGNA